MSVTQHTAENLFVDGANGVRYAYRRFGADSGRRSGLVSIPEQLSSVEASPLLCAGFTTYNALRKAWSVSHGVSKAWPAKESRG